MGEQAADGHGYSDVSRKDEAVDPGRADDSVRMAVVNGDEQFTALSAGDRSKAHELIDARIAVRAAQERFGEAAGSGDDQ